MICLVPFDMARFDGISDSEKDSLKAERPKPIVDRIIEIAKVSQSIVHILSSFSPLVVMSIIM